MDEVNNAQRGHPAGRGFGWVGKRRADGEDRTRSAFQSERGTGETQNRVSGQESTQRLRLPVWTVTARYRHHWGRLSPLRSAKKSDAALSIWMVTWSGDPDRWRPSLPSQKCGTQVSFCLILSRLRFTGKRSDSSGLVVPRDHDSGWAEGEERQPGKEVTNIALPPGSPSAAIQPQAPASRGGRWLASTSRGRNGQGCGMGGGDRPREREEETPPERISAPGAFPSGSSCSRGPSRNRARRPS